MKSSNFCHFLRKSKIFIIFCLPSLKFWTKKAEILYTLCLTIPLTKSWSFALWFFVCFCMSLEHKANFVKNWPQILQLCGSTARVGITLEKFCLAEIKFRPWLPTYEKMNKIPLLVIQQQPHTFDTVSAHIGLKKDQINQKQRLVNHSAWNWAAILR